ncbi:MAG TPA: HD domain-containing phosphohydrolase [Pyrinomonadaceae bacterium]|nr:HD domain-containing phosphohydrolase [Pyrinomonadaceae bacterium]
MSQKKTKVSLIYFVIFTLLLVGLVPLLLTGWLLSGRSGRELRSVENRYQIQLVQEKARQIEMFAQRYGDLVLSVGNSLELANNPAILSSPQTEQHLGNVLKDNPNLLALYLKPVEAESLSLFRPGVFSPGELEVVMNDVYGKLTTQDLLIGQPIKLATNGEYAMTMASQVSIDNRTVASVIAVVSLKEISRGVVGMNPTSEDELWKAGLPIVFVVDQNGTAFFHPDTSLVDSKRPLTDLKIVDEWRQSNAQIQSGLVPFTADYKGNSHDMIGAYSTAHLGKNRSLGVITMQDESKALASVGEMRFQTWMISLAFALAALVIGMIAARMLTKPIQSLSIATQRIAGGDLSTRVESSNVTEIGTLGESFNTMADELEEHIASLAKAAKENRELFVGTVKALAAAIDGKDKYTRGHSERVARISVAIGKQLSLPEGELEILRISALLHDVGKIAIDDSILKKPAALTDEEFTIMKTHPVKGYKIMSQIPAMKDFLPGMYMHHEMVNGKGYPQGLTDEQIPLQAKIVSVADTFDAMTIDRPYSKGMLLPDAIERIKSFVGTRYDNAVVEALVRGCKAGEIGQGVVKFMNTNTEAQTKREEILKSADERERKVA